MRRTELSKNSTKFLFISHFDPPSQVYVVVLATFSNYFALYDIPSEFRAIKFVGLPTFDRIQSHLATKTHLYSSINVFINSLGCRFHDEIVPILQMITLCVAYTT